MAILKLLQEHHTGMDSYPTKKGSWLFLSSLVSTRFNKRNKNKKVIILNEKKSLGAIDFKLK
jgi:hypothetical protein